MVNKKPVVLVCYVFKGNVFFFFVEWLIQLFRAIHLPKSNLYSYEYMSSEVFRRHLGVTYTRNRFDGGLPGELHVDGTVASVVVMDMSDCWLAD